MSGNSKSKVSEDDKKLIVDLHNKHRAETNPIAKNMMKLVGVFSFFVGMEFDRH